MSKYNLNVRLVTLSEALFIKLNVLITHGGHIGDLKLKQLHTSILM